MFFEEPIRRILRSFCHVEWYEVDELAVLIKSGRAKFNVDLLKSQFLHLIENSDGMASEINKITSNEFESDEEARAWVVEIYRALFG